MKTRLLIAFLLGSLALSSQAQEAQPAVPAPAPRLACDGPEFDFGVVDNSQTVEHTFLLRNEGDLTLEISQVRPSCGCTVAHISERNVPAGGETKISTKLSLAGRQGQQHKAITVESNDPQQPRFVLTLKGTAGTALDVQPSRLMQSQLAPGSQPTGTVQITGMAGTPFKVLAVESTSEQISARVVTVEEGRVYQLVVSPTQPLSPGQTEATLTVKTDHPQRPNLQVPVLFMAKADLVVAPRELIFPMPSSEPVTRYLIVRANDNQAFQIARVEVPSPEITTETTAFGANGYRVQLSNLRPDTSLNQRVVRIFTSIPGQAPLDVPIRIIASTPVAP